MARTDSLTNYLTDVADAIKAKKGDDTPINASTFDSEIINLPGRSPTAIEVKGTTVTKIVGNSTVHEGDFIQQDDVATVSSGSRQVVSNYYYYTKSLYMGDNKYLTLGAGNSQNRPSYWALTDEVSYSTMIDRNDDLINACIQDTFPDVEITSITFISQDYSYCYCSNCFDGVIESCRFRINNSEGYKFVLVYLYYKLVDGVPRVVSVCCEDTLYASTPPLREPHQVSATQAIAVECSSPGGMTVPGWGAVVLNLTADDQLVIAVQYTIYETDKYTWGGACGFHDKSHSRVPFIIYRTDSSSTSSSASREYLTAYTLNENNEVVFLRDFDASRNLVPFRGCKLFASNIDEYGTFVITYTPSYSGTGYAYSFKYDEETQTVAMIGSITNNILVGSVLTSYMLNEKAFLIRVVSTNTRVINGTLAVVVWDTKTNELDADYAKISNKGTVSGYASNVGGTYATFVAATRKGDSLEFAYTERNTWSVSGAIPVRLVGILKPTISRATTFNCIGVAKETKQPGETIRIVQGPSPEVSEEAV